MITCSFCGSTAFDDMDICYGCLQPLFGAEPVTHGIGLSHQGDLDDLEVEEPSEDTVQTYTAKTSTRFHVQLSDSLGYDIYQSKRGVTIELVEEQR